LVRFSVTNALAVIPMSVLLLVAWNPSDPVSLAWSIRSPVVDVLGGTEMVLLKVTLPLALSVGESQPHAKVGDPSVQEKVPYGWAGMVLSTENFKTSPVLLMLSSSWTVAVALSVVSCTVALALAVVSSGIGIPVTVSV